MNRFLSFYYQQIKPYFLQKPLSTIASSQPFFILSSGRSGSTLLRKLLLANAPVNIPPESGDLLPKLLKFYLRNNGKSWDYIVTQSVAIFNAEESTRFWNLQLSPQELEQLSSPQYKDKSLAGIAQFFYFRYALKYHYTQEIWGDKTPFLIFRLSWINMLYPSAKFIFLLRDGRDVVNSYIKMGYQLEDAAGRWLESVKAMEQQKRKVSADRILFIRYEELVKSPENVLTDTYRFLKVEPFASPRKDFFLGDDILPHHKNLWSEIRQDSIAKWKEELHEFEKSKLLKLLGDKLEEYRYH